MRTIEFDLKDVRLDPGTNVGQSPRIAIEATDLVKVSSESHSLMMAAEHIMGKTDEEIDHMSSRIIEGHVRTVLRKLSGDAIDVDREVVAAKIQAHAQQDLMNVGLEVRAFTLNRVHLKD